jgi:hypothetical protein
MSRADVLEAEGLMLKGMLMSYMGSSCKAKLPIISICSVRAEDRELMCIVGPRSHKASKADRLGGKMWKIIKRMSGNNIWELRYKSGRRWGRILSLRCRICTIYEEEVKEKVGVGSECNNWYGGIPSLTMLGIEIRQWACGLLNGSFTVRSHIQQWCL